MLKWLKNNWKLVTAVFMALLVGAVLTALYFFVPPVAVAITGFLAVNAPAIGAAITAMSPVAGAFVVGALGSAATLAFTLIWNLGVKLTNSLDAWINPPGKDKKPAFSPLVEDEESDNESQNSPKAPQKGLSSPNPMAKLGGNPSKTSLITFDEDDLEEKNVEKVKATTSEPIVSEHESPNPNGATVLSS
ncbi:hypothetical protein Lrub_2776 [Legionella rubrilucens]|uniref:Transmembrane protein n=1 Tax=Legionella rubrilucens TaxID=458 RepID=A0A0W0XN02_9GAMM|nr:hypothetical protein [Legionella rubrilucens]KTD45979.1 hypothetical protein Lrub_2776 [Legionella rubrilucens]